MEALIHQTDGRIELCIVPHGMVSDPMRRGPPLAPLPVVQLLVFSCDEDEANKGNRNVKTFL
jgi:hypothetical protein